MRAEDLEEKFPVVPVDCDAVDAARMMAEHHLPGLLVTAAEMARPRSRQIAVTRDEKLHGVITASHRLAAASQS